MPAMDSCRWASYIAAEPKTSVGEKFVSLPQQEQVARGMELLGMLKDAPLALDARKTKKIHSARVKDVDWKVLVKHSFIEVVIPRSDCVMRRCLSDSDLPRSAKVETRWESIVKDADTKAQDSDASTKDEAEDNGWSSEGEADAETIAPFSPAALSNQLYIETCWVPVPMAMVSPAASFGSFGSPLNVYAPAFTPLSWADQIIGEEHEWRTTVMIRNMPNNYTRDMLLELVDSMGFAGSYDFAYLPIDFQSQAGLGYAFINFATVAEAQRCFEVFENFSDWKVPSEKVCTVTWSSPTQGLAQHLERYKNSPVMHHSLPDEWRPVLLQQGVRVAFPPPSKPIKTPKVRQHKNA